MEDSRLATKNMSGIKPSFKPVTKNILYRTIARSAGEVGSGKTYFWLTAPKPVFVHSIDQGLEGVVEQLMNRGYINEGDVQVAEYDWCPGDIEFKKLRNMKESETMDLQDLAIARRDQLIANHFYALESGARTIVYDKESDVWQLFRYAEFGAPNDNPKNYDELNQRYIALINAVKSYDCSLGLIQSVKDEWGAFGEVNKSTGRRGLAKSGRRVAWGFDRLDELVFMDIEHIRRDGEFFLKIGKCRQNSNLQDQEVPATTFAEFGTLLIDGSTEDDWA